MRDSVLIVAAQAALGAEVARTLLSAGYEVELASDKVRARLLIRKHSFHAAVISLSSGQAADLTFMRDMQNAVGKLIVLGQDARNSSQFTTAFPDALVCSTPPLEQERLVRFLREPAKSQTSNKEGEPNVLLFDGCTLNVAGHTFVNAHKQEVALTRGEFSLLLTLVRNAGRVLSRSQLRGRLDRRGDSYDRGVDMLITRLRRKIEADPANPRLILTLAGVGYKFTGGVVGRDVEEFVSATTHTSRRNVERRLGASERRPITVLSCQIIGFADLSAKMDPEDLQSVLKPVYQACHQSIARFGGTIVNALGDNVLAYFGHPEVHETDAENAVRAGLELVEHVGQIKAASIGVFKARVGIATSVALIDPLNVAGMLEPIAGGEALIQAHHMHKAAPVGQVVIAGSTRELVGHFFRMRELSSLPIEGTKELALGWCVIDEIEGIARFDALRRERMVHLVGRAGELEHLMRCWAKTLEGNGQVVLLSGDAGLGKSRLVAELGRGVQAQDHVALRYSGSPYAIAAPMEVLIEELRRSSGFLRDDTADAKLEKLKSLFALLPAPTAATDFFADILGIDASRFSKSQMSPQKRKDIVFKSLISRMESIAANTVLLVIAEDAQWIDATSIEFFAYLVKRVANMRAMLVLTGRPEFTAPWAIHSHITTLPLSRLSRSDSIELLHEVAGAQRVFPRVEAEIISRADGIPLFIEELTKSLLEHGKKADDPRAWLGNGTELPSIPKTLQALLVARLDGLTRGRYIAQAGAVIGQEFSFELLQCLTDVNEPDLLESLDELVNSGLVFRRGLTSQATFTFKHALIRDAAYGLLLRPERQRLHTILLKAYEERIGETAQAHPELLAHHAREAGEPIKAITYQLLAAERALERSALPEASAHLMDARKLVMTLSNEVERLKFELKLEICLGRTLTAEHGYAAPQTREAYNHARVICGALGDEVSLPLIVLGQWLSAWNAADHQAALGQARELYEWGKRNNEPAGVAVAHIASGMSLSAVGDLVQARRHLEEGLHINQFVLSDGRVLLASATDGRVTLLSYLHDCLLLQGFPDQAQAIASEVTVPNPQQLYSYALAQLHTARMHVFEGDAARAAETSASALQISEAQGYSYFVGVSKVYRGWALAHKGDTNQGILLCERGLADLAVLGAKSWLPRYIALLAECYERANDIARGIQVIGDAVAALRATGEHLWELEIHRLQGLLLLRSGEKIDVIEECFQIAMNKARQQNAKLLELRAATSLARLFKQQCAREKGRDVLFPVYSWFTEGFDFIDLSDARAVLDGL